MDLVKGQVGTRELKTVPEYGCITAR